MNRPPLNSRIRFLQYPNYEATVKTYTDRGFVYEYDEPLQWGRADWGLTTGGEMFCDLDWCPLETRIEVMERL